MFSWMEGLIGVMGDAIGGAINSMGAGIINDIWDGMLQWVYEQICNAMAEFFGSMGEMGAAIFDLEWVEATVSLFTLFGWALFCAGVVVAAFDLAMEYQSGRANIKNTALNVLKGFMACSLIGTLPIELYRFSITLQTIFAKDLSKLFAGTRDFSIGDLCASVFVGGFNPAPGTKISLYTTGLMIAFVYCVIKLFFQNIKRGGILLIQMAVGSLYMFSVPRGYTDGFVQWVKQVIATCLTAFLQTTLFYLGLITFEDSSLLGIGIMLAANEVARIAQQFGLDTSAKFNVMNVVHATSSAINLTRTVAKVAGR